jgi:hypothetical protein
MHNLLLQRLLQFFFGFFQKWFFTANKFILGCDKGFPLTGE